MKKTTVNLSILSFRADGQGGVTITGGEGNKQVVDAFGGTKLGGADRLLAYKTQGVDNGNGTATFNGSTLRKGEHLELTWAETEKPWTTLTKEEKEEVVAQAREEGIPLINTGRLPDSGNTAPQWLHETDIVLSLPDPKERLNQMARANEVRELMGRPRPTVG